MIRLLVFPNSDNQEGLTPDKYKSVRSLQALLLGGMLEPDLRYVLVLFAAKLSETLSFSLLLEMELDDDLHMMTPNTEQAVQLRNFFNQPDVLNYVCVHLWCFFVLFFVVFVVVVFVAFLFYINIQVFKL